MAYKQEWPHGYLTVGALKAQLASIPDETFVLSAGCDCVGLADAVIGDPEPTDVFICDRDGGVAVERVKIVAIAIERGADE